MRAPEKGPGVYPTPGDRKSAMKRGGPDRPVVVGAKDWQVFSVSVDSRGVLYSSGFNGCSGELFHWGHTGPSCLGSINRYCFKLAQWTPEARKEFARLVRIDKRDRASNPC